MSGDLGLNIGGEGTSHAVESELGGEGKGRVLRLRGILKGERFNADEVFAAVRTNGGIRGEVNGVGKGNINAGVQSLQASLLLSIADIDRDFGGAEILKRRGRAAILPCDNSWLSTRIGGGSDWSSEEDGGEDRGGKGEGNKNFREHCEAS